MNNNNQSGNKIILFDGICNICSAFLNFVYLNDPKALFRLTWLQSEEAEKILDTLGLSRNEFNSIIYLDHSTAFFKSTAFLKIVRQLRFPWPVLWIGVIIPKPVRDWIYDIVAKNRYRWFGKKDHCLIPIGELEDRFLK